MQEWDPQRYRRRGQQLGVDPEILRHAIVTGEQTIAVHAALPPIFTLRHLAHLTSVDYGFLREWSRVILKTLAKYSGSPNPRIERTHAALGVNCIPSPDLLQVQRWIARRILALGQPHRASFAYAKGSSIKHAAAVPLFCCWLIKLDVRQFSSRSPKLPHTRFFAVWVINNL